MASLEDDFHVDATLAPQLHVADSCRVYTPSVLCEALVRALFTGDAQNWLEPCFGDGAFLRALSKIGIRAGKIAALEIDTQKRECDRLGTCVRGVDALQWLATTDRKFDVVVGNPPYISLKRVEPPLCSSALRWRLPNGAGALDRTGNLWVSFVYAALRVMNAGGSLGLVLPASFEYASYAAPLRAALPGMFASTVVIRSRKALFESVQEGCVVLICRGYGCEPQWESRIACEDLQGAIESIEQHISLPYVSRARSPSSFALTLGDIGKFRIGAVTGDAKYFVLKESDRLRHGIPDHCVVPSLTKARHVSVDMIDHRAWDRLRRANEPIWIFSPSKRGLALKSVKDYLASGMLGACNVEGHKLAGRKPWFLVPLPPRPDFFVGPVLKRDLRFVVNRSRFVTFTNSLYGFYLHHGVSKGLRDTLPGLLRSDVVQQQLEGLVRRYAAGLCKFEPSDLMSIGLPIVKTT